MKEEKQRCKVSTSEGEIDGTILIEYEEISGEIDGGFFAVIELDNGQLIKVRMSDGELEI